MPDAGDFETRNAPASPPGWGDAFAALPVETPTAAGWERVQARLPAATMPRVRRRWPLWVATAAALALVAAVPWRMLPPAPDRHSREGGNPASLAHSSRSPARSALSSSGSDHANASQAGMASERKALDSRLRGNDEQMPIAARHGKPHRATRVAPAQRPVRTAAEPAGTTRLAAEDAIGQPIESLHAESAQLEQLLAMVRDERVASATSVALSSDLDDHIAGIDSALAQPGLDAVDRDRLWQQRVDALRQLVGIETTNRLLSARGERFNASLVSID